MMQASEALSALDAKRDAERSLAAAANCPAWRHMIFGAMMGALVASPAVELPYRFIILALVLAAMPIIVWSDRKRTGVFINGYRRGRTLLVSFAILAVVLALYALSLHLAQSDNSVGAPAVLGLVATIAATLGSVLWQRVFVRELGL